MLKVGITGGIGSGKSTACRIFALLGVPIYEADARARWLQIHDQLLRQQIIEHFGVESYLPDGSLNRSYLAQTVFNCPEKLQLLNSLVHPRVREDTAAWIEAQKMAGKSYVLKEAALLIESGSYKQLDRLIVVTAPEDLRISRVLQRDPYRTVEEVKAIISRQLPEKEKIKLADFVIYNDGKQMLIPQVLTIHRQLLAQAQKLSECS